MYATRHMSQNDTEQTSRAQSLIAGLLSSCLKHHDTVNIRKTSNVKKHYTHFTCVLNSLNSTKRHTKRYPNVNQVWRRSVMMSRREWGRILGNWVLHTNIELFFLYNLFNLNVHYHFCNVHIRTTIQLKRWEFINKYIRCFISFLSLKCFISVRKYRVYCFNCGHYWTFTKATRKRII